MKLIHSKIHIVLDLLFRKFDFLFYFLLILEEKKLENNQNLKNLEILVPLHHFFLQKESTFLYENEEKKIYVNLSDRRFLLLTIFPVEKSKIWFVFIEETKISTTNPINGYLNMNLKLQYNQFIRIDRDKCYKIILIFYFTWNFSLFSNERIKKTFMNKKFVTQYYEWKRVSFCQYIK